MLIPLAKMNAPTATLIVDFFDNLRLLDYMSAAFLRFSG